MIAVRICQLADAACSMGCSEFECRHGRTHQNPTFNLSFNGSPFVSNAVFEIHEKYGFPQSIMRDWKKISVQPLPIRKEILVWNGRCRRIGIIKAEKGKVHDAKTNQVLYPFPTHWMELPTPPYSITGEPS